AAVRGSPRQERGGSGCTSVRRWPRIARASTLHHVSTMLSLPGWFDRSFPRYWTGKPDGSVTEPCKRTQLSLTRSQCHDGGLAVWDGFRVRRLLAELGVGDRTMPVRGPTSTVRRP